MVNDLQNSYREAVTQERGVDAYNKFVEHFSSSPCFDSRRGTVNEGEIVRLMQLRLNAQERAAFPNSPESQTDLGHESLSLAELVKVWVDELHRPRETTLGDISECLHRIADATPEEEDQARWALSSTEIRLWLTASKFHVLCISPETSTDSVFSPISYTVAMLAESLFRSKTAPVAAYFCGLRRWEDGATSGNGALNMLSSLAGQLIQEIGDKVPDFNTACLQGRDRDVSLGKIDELLSLLRDIFNSMPPGSDVFVLIDSFCRLEMIDKPGSSAAIGGLLDIWRSCKATVKLVLTDVVFYNIPDSVQRDSEMLYVPDDVDGGRYGFNTEQAGEVADRLVIETQGTID
ncbi:hypothetical protein INS49_007666 [Diaporthe citri]|uniref:uncharacterized protein n=1 Tax=Diaporthe citri TaxID=83186 RepID=UPI001C8090CB|nr:uncharacterized protein INS49_007666 [Diaporthe citri]KAG6362574.1 hypothetical protein INS49_007666 [Diaporthe citri]